MKPDLPSSTTSLAVVISGSVVAVSLGIFILVTLHRKRKLFWKACSKCCSRTRCWCCNKGSTTLGPDQVREFLNMEDLLLEVDDGTTARLASTDNNNADSTSNNSNDEGWTMDTLVPNILKSRSIKRRDSRDDLRTPLL